MGNIHGDALIEIAYDIEVETRKTNPSEEIMKVHKITPQHYFVIPNTEMRLDEALALTKDKRDIGDLSDDMPKDEKEIKYYGFIEYGDVGSIKKITLTQKVIHIDLELDKKEFSKFREGTQTLTFKPGKLEEILDIAKEDFSKKMKEIGLPCDKSKIYFKLTGDYHKISPDGKIY